MAVQPTYAEVKTYLQIPVATTTHDALIQSLIPAAVANLERLSGRQISASSNQTSTYSTDGSSALVIHDRPFSDPSRVVVLNGITQTENQDYWMLPDRRYANITAMIQLQAFNGYSYKGDPDWWDKNLDTYYAKYNTGMPNDLQITGILGMPLISEDTKLAITSMTAYLFKLKDASANTIFSPDGAVLDLSDLPANVQQWIINWRIRTAVALVR